MGYLLEIKDLRVQFRTERAVANALNGLDMTIEKGESFGLVGETGAGKTTTALAVLNLLASSAKHSGEILFNGKSVFSMNKKELLDMRGKKIAMIFQNPLTALNPVFTVGEQIAMVLRAHMGMSHRKAKRAAGDLLELVGIPAYRLNDYPMQFSGGMRQRVGIAAALSCNPELVIADEPTTALDVTIQAQILELMKDLQMKYSTSFLMITHNLGIISELCSKVAVIYAGCTIESGSVYEVFSNPAHPYTRGLLGALPSLDETKDELTAIPGLIADPRSLPAGCSFHPRCESCNDDCRSVFPEMVKLRDDHFVRCYRV